MKATMSYKYLARLKNPFSEKNTLSGIVDMYGLSGHFL